MDPSGKHVYVVKLHGHVFLIIDNEPMQNETGFLTISGIEK